MSSNTLSDNNQTEPTNPKVNPYDILGFVHNSDGSVTRKPAVNILNASIVPPDPTSNTSQVLTKDIPINQSKNTSLRLYVPRDTHDDYPSPANKLPLIVFYHGGGFVMGSPRDPFCHTNCMSMAVDVHAVVASPSYRLAPEHRLPAAYDDCEEALNWIKTTSEEWLTNFADFSNCYIMGGSAGGNIAYHVALRVAAADVDDLKPVKIKGLILHQPYFSGTERTQSELRLAHNVMFPLCVSDLMWELGLPIGVDRDHEYCNPTVEGGSSLKFCGRFRILGWKVLVTGCDGDPLFDRQIELAEMLEEKGVDVVRRFEEGGYHGLEVFEPCKAKALYVCIKNFISSSSSSFTDPDLEVVRA